MVPASQSLYELVVQGNVEHEGDAAFTRHIESAVAREAFSGGWRLSKGERLPARCANKARICPRGYPSRVESGTLGWRIVAIGDAGMKLSRTHQLKNDRQATNTDRTLSALWVWR